MFLENCRRFRCESPSCDTTCDQKSSAAIQVPKRVKALLGSQLKCEPKQLGPSVRQPATEGSGLQLCVTAGAEPSLSCACEFCPASFGGGAAFYQAAADKKLQATCPRVKGLFGSQLA